MGQELRFLGCFARSRSTDFSDAAVLQCSLRTRTLESEYWV